MALQLYLWIASGIVLALVYLVCVNSALTSVPSEVERLSGPRWTPEQLKSAYRDLEKKPIDYTHLLPPRLDRRYIVTGGNGLVGGFIVLQLLARGTPPENIRILDIRKAERSDFQFGKVTEVSFLQTDITSRTAVDLAFHKPWDEKIRHLPLTVFHTAAVILASDRSKYLYDFPEAVNVNGTRNVLAAAKEAGADVFIATSSASISIRPVEAFSIWPKEPKHYWQILDERDSEQPLRPREEFFGNYPLSKAVAERLVWSANSESFRTGTIRPANGVYGNPTDNTVGILLSRSVMPTWVPHIVQSYVHGANVAVAHLHHEAALVAGGHKAPQAGRAYVVTDPNPPISYGDLYTAISTLSVHPFELKIIPPVLILGLSYIIEWYCLLPFRWPALGKFLPKLKGDVRQLQPAMFSICTHLIGSDEHARKAIDKGGLGYKGVLTTMQGMVLEILEWNREHPDASGGTARKQYTNSISLAEQLRQVFAVPTPIAGPNGALGDMDEGICCML
ncbi:cholesterol dehydrogenase [Paramyrothecium foliicola]|nr:cholesterol dehydrogenase [Paramyrothecium foliicola]